MEQIQQDLLNKKTELNEILDKKLNGILLRAKADFVEYNEKNTSFFSSMEKKHAEKKIISRLNVNDRIITDQKEILEETKQYYANLYSKKECGDTNYDFFDNSIKKLNENEKISCEGLLTDRECANALKDMKNNKSPGSDGITTEFYKIFWNDIKGFLVDSLNYSYNEGSLSEIQSQSLITLLPKQDKDTSNLKNWRPISLLNTDYKITAKAIANRIKPLLPSIISDTQTGFIKGRYIGENVRLLDEVMDYVEDANIPCLLFFSDFEKAFDSVDRNYLFKTLAHFNFGNSIKHWINTLYNGAKSCVYNNGHMTEFFRIERGVRQGCPLSPYLFIIAIELLSQYISKHQDIKGIRIGGAEIKNTLFADDATFITDGSKKSFEILISILDNFEKISGLKLNNKKCNVLRAGSFKPSQNVYLEHRGFQWSSEKAKALGITFTTNRNMMLKLNLEPKLDEFKTCLKQWQHRKLTLIGKVTVIKTFALPKLIYPLTVLQTPSTNIIKQINDIMYDFLWDSKPSKIKKDTVIKNYEDGGIKMIDICKFINSLKCTWIKRIGQLNETNPLKHIYAMELKKYGENLIFESILTETDIKDYFKNRFLKNILIAWKNILNFNEKNITLKTVIWNNSNFRSGDKPIFYKKWFENGIKTLEDIYDTRTNRLYSFDFIRYIYNIHADDFLKYSSLFNSIQKIINDNLENAQLTPHKELLTKLLSSQSPNKLLYKFQIDKNNTEIKQTQKWEEMLNKHDIDWKKIFKLTFESTIDTRLRNFNYKYLMRIVRTNKDLFKFSLANTTLCDFCGRRTECLHHLFWECEYTQGFWTQVSNTLKNLRLDINITFENISLGIPSLKQHKIPINYILMTAKYYIFNCKCNKNFPNFNHFKNFMKQKLCTERLIAERKGKLEIHNAPWSTFVIR